jgi:hypothetical protein
MSTTTNVNFRLGLQLRLTAKSIRVYGDMNIVEVEFRAKNQKQPDFEELSTVKLLEQ